MIAAIRAGLAARADPEKAPDMRAYAWVDPDEIERCCATHELSPLSPREALCKIARIRGAS
jgi:hypothetical protein